MKPQFEIKDKNIINDILVNAKYGTLALCEDNIPYSVPVNFVNIEENIYFHGSQNGRKAEMMSKNPLCSFSVVEPYSLIQSYFSSLEGLACPATHFFRSVSIQGKIEIVSDYDEKVLALELLMKKLQKEGKYKPMGDEVYQKTINITQVYKIVSLDIKGKVKLGQHLPQERFDMILEHLELRGNEIDKLTIKEMREQREKCN
ncbi:MAG: pyridoxamine 5'-phosphate oxidase family protein [Campylobacterales bacterium]|nr:pyridoxamine 5'-phosphate oxidase family protein [Campylobacterales bacterium]